jgi:hypothetical protein
MGQAITSITDMVSYSGELRRAAKHQPVPEVAQKIQRSAQELENTALKHISQAAPGIGKLLDTFA